MSKWNNGSFETELEIEKKNYNFLKNIYFELLKSHDELKETSAKLSSELSELKEKENMWKNWDKANEKLREENTKFKFLLEDCKGVITELTDE
ncbi:MAG: hypothetical protein WCG15_06755, partial [Actinomycetes bacterium]